MILKDGDGSFHRFPLTENGEYDSAKGTLMRLEHDEENGEYTITRKDNIVYHFDENSMKLLRFSNPNGNELEFAYDERGNLKSVKNTVGEEIILTYNTAQENPRSEDYIYKNDHVDILKTVSWTQSASDEPKSIVYHYEYNDKDKLTKAYTLIEGNDEYAESFTYDEDNELSAITNPENNTYALLCTNGKIDKVTDPVGNDMLLRYFSGKTVVMNQNGAASSYIFDGEGRVTKKVDPLNHEINYTYNDDFQVTGVSYDNIVLNENKTISYSYTYDENGNLTGVTGSGGSSVQYEGYNKWNKPQTVKVKKADNSWLITSYTYDEQGNLESTTDPTQKVSVNEYAKINGEDGYLVSSTDRLGKKTVYTYNAKGQVTQINEQNANGTEARRAAQYTYDAYGHTATSTDALNNTTSYTYNKLGFLIETQFADESTVSSTYSLTGNILSQTNARGNTVYYAYDDAGRLTQTKYKRMENGALVDKIISSIAYQRWDSDDDGILDADRVVETDGMGVASTQYYDKAGRMVKKTSGGVTVQYEYDKIGNVVKVTDGDGRVTRAQYDENGNNVKIEKVSLQAGVENIENTFLYDLLGNKTSEKDANGAETSYEYDELNRLKKVTQYLSATEPLYTSYEYDIINGKNIINRVTDAKGNVDETWFDVFGRKVKDRSIGSASMITSYSYDENNRLTEVERNDGSKEENEYDELGQLKQTKYFEAGENNSTYRLSYAYDANGNVTNESVTKGGKTHITEYSYDELDRIIQKTQGKDGVGALTIDYTYNIANQLVSISYPKEDNQSGVAASGTGMQTISYGYNSNGQLASVSLGGDVVRQYTYTAGGAISSIKDYRDFEGSSGGYIKKAYTYNTFGAITKTTTTDHPSGEKKEEQIITYDKNFNILTENTYSNYKKEKTVSKSYKYDSIGRLVNATNDGISTTYTYDAVGNRETQTVGRKTLTYHYNNLDQLLNIKENGKTVATYTYDRRGNQTKESTLAVTLSVGEEGQEGYQSKDYFKETIYEYDLRDLMSKVTINLPEPKENPTSINDITTKTEVTCNSYDAVGKRIERTENNNTTKFYYTGQALLYSTNEQNVLETENILDRSGSIIASKRFTGSYTNKYYFYNYDIRGSVTNIVDRNGNLVKGYSYDEFGKTQSDGESGFKNDVTFTGSIADTSSDLQYMSSRFYDSSTGRFLTQDTYSGNPYDPWTQHLYSYCGNNPVNMVDPTGHFAEELLPWLGPIWEAALAEPSFVGEVVAGVVTVIAVAGLIINGTSSSTTPSRTKNLPLNPPMPNYDSPKKAPAKSIPLNPPMPNYVNGKTSEKDKDKEKESDVPIALEKEEQKKPIIVYRVYGGDSGLYGHSWTTVNPKTIDNYRDAAGLPSGGISGFNNTGEYLATGVLNDTTGVKTRLALPLDGNRGNGVVELLVPNPRMQITVTNIERMETPF